MKTLVLSMISIAATIAAMTACTSEGDPIDNIDNGQPVEIQLNAGVVTTKAAITSNADGKLSADLATELMGQILIGEQLLLVHLKELFWLQIKKFQ